MKRHRLLIKKMIVLILLSAVLTMQGCILTLTAIRTYKVKYGKSPRHQTASVIIQGDPDRAFNALVLESESLSDLDFIDIDPDLFLIQTEKDGEKGLFQIIPLEKDFFQVTVTVDSPKEKQKQQKEIILRMIERVCNVLNEECEIPEVTSVKPK